jgi:hypothetical protein
MAKLMADLDTLRTVYQQTIRPSENHLTDEQWEQLACDEMTPSEREQAAEHIQLCSQCAQVFRVVMAVKAEAHEFDPYAPPSRAAQEAAQEAAQSRRRPRFFAGLAAAAAVVGAFFIVAYMQQLSPAPSGQSQEIVTRAAGSDQTPTLLAPLGQVDDLPRTFSWQQVDEARGYVVELFDGEGELLWRSDEAVASPTAWPPEISAAPSHYYWRVLAASKMNGEITASGLEAFEILSTTSHP